MVDISRDSNPAAKKIRDISQETGKSRFGEFLSMYSKLYGALLAVKVQVAKLIYSDNKYETYADAEWERHEEFYATNKYLQIFENEELKAVFTPTYRLAVRDMGDPRITEGLRISMESIRLMKERNEKANIKFIVLLIPTKELVFKDALYESSNDISEDYKALVENEEIMLEKTKTFLNKEGIRFVDVLVSLRKSIRDNRQPYFKTADGHPNATGHRVIAEVVHDEIDSHF